MSERALGGSRRRGWLATSPLAISSRFSAAFEGDSPLHGGIPACPFWTV
jgi:hypothetical protein